MVLTVKKLLGRSTERNFQRQIKKPFRKELKLDLSNYVTKSDLKNKADADTSNFAKRNDLTGLKSHIDKLDID